MRLHELQNSHRAFQKRKRRGRGVGSKLGKTSGRGHKGAGSRSGWKSRARYEGGQNPLYRKSPVRGFTRGAFIRRFDTINLSDISRIFNDGDTVNIMALFDKGLVKGVSYGLKVLGNGEITKKVTIEAQAISESAKNKLQAAGISFTVES